MAGSRRDRAVQIAQPMFETRVRTDENRALEHCGIRILPRQPGERVFDEDCRSIVPGREPKSLQEERREACLRATLCQMQNTKGTHDPELSDALASDDGDGALIGHSDEQDDRRLGWLRVKAYVFDGAGERVRAVRGCGGGRHGVGALSTAAFTGGAGA